MTPRRIRTLLIAAAAAATVLATAGPVAPAHAGAASQRDTIRVVATDSRYVVYVEYPAGSDGKPDFASGELHARNAGGTTRDLGAYDASKIQGATDGQFSLAGAMLTSFGPAETVRWWDIASATNGTTDLPTNGWYLGASPAGWLLVILSETNGVNNGSSMQIMQETSDGTTTNFAAPFGHPRGDQIEAWSGPDGVLTISDVTGRFEYLPWTDPTHPTRVKVSLPANHKHAVPEPFCGGVTTRVASCTLTFNKDDNGFNATVREVLFLNGHRTAVRVNKVLAAHDRGALKHPGALTATGHGLAAVGSDRHLYTMAFHGKKSHRAHGKVAKNAGLTPGYRGVLITSPHEIDYVRHPSATIKRIVVESAS
jgi:hypothetical protein